MSYEPPAYGSPPPPPPGGNGGGYGGPPPGGGYGAPGPGFGGQAQSTSVMAIISLVTGILSIICCGSFIFGIAAVILGFLGRKEINESNGAKKGAGLAMAGLILGGVGIAFSLLYWILVIAGGFDGYYG